jgi:hypothetical protein
MNTMTTSHQQINVVGHAGNEHLVYQLLNSSDIFFRKCVDNKVYKLNFASVDEIAPQVSNVVLITREPTVCDFKNAIVGAYENLVLIDQNLTGDKITLLTNLIGEADNKFMLFDGKKINTVVVARYFVSSEFAYLDAQACTQYAKLIAGE